MVKPEELELGQQLYGISIDPYAWANIVSFEGQVLNFNEKTVVLWGEVPDHNGLEEREGMIFTKIENLYIKHQERDKVMKKMLNNDPQ